MNSDTPGKSDGSPNGVDLTTFPAAAKLVERVGEFMQEVQNMWVFLLAHSFDVSVTFLPFADLLDTTSSLSSNQQTGLQAKT
jgi:hypothetical protein